MIVAGRSSCTNETRLSEAEYAHLSVHRDPSGFWDHLVEMRSDSNFEPVTLHRYPQVSRTPSIANVR